MASADETSRDGSDLADVSAETLAVVLHALRWQLTEARWQAVEQSLAPLNEAVEAADPKALAAALYDLESVGPSRILRIRTDVTGPPPPVRDRLNILVHSLRTISAADRPATQDAARDDDLAR